MFRSMRIFSSSRERNLWLLTVAVLVAIYTTLGSVPALAGFLSRNGLLEISFAAGMLLVGLIIVVHVLKSRSDAFGWLILLSIVASYYLVFVRMDNPTERTHLIEYGIVGILIYEAFLERVHNGGKVAAPALFAVLVAALFGILDEFIQLTLPNRVFDLRDILFNVLAGAMAILSSALLSCALRRKSSSPSD